MKTSQYNIFVTSFLESHILAYNTLTGAFFVMSDTEFDYCNNMLSCLDNKEKVSAEKDHPITQALLKGGFIIDDCVNEFQVIRDRYYEGKERVAGLNMTIAPTVNCNLACTYCFQSHSKKNMDKDNVQAIKGYVSSNLRANSYLSVTWFGGEPLLAFDVIVDLCEYFSTICNERNCTYTQSFITNGVLLDESRTGFIASQKNIDQIQITLDGPIDVHDKRRLRRGGGGTYAQIMNNIERSANLIPIIIRVNVDLLNCSYLNELVDDLVERGLRDNVSIYLGRVAPYTEQCSSSVSSECLSIEEFAAVDAQFRFYLLQRGFLLNGNLPTPKIGALCGADSLSSVVFAPDNLMFHCWNEAAMPIDKASGVLCADEDERTKLGELVRTSLMLNNHTSWTNYSPFMHEECNLCKFQPLCMSSCPWQVKNMSKDGTPLCSPLKFNLADRLRMYHLQKLMVEASRKNDVAELKNSASSVTDGVSI